MLPEFPYFVKCPDCSVFFKINDKAIVGKDNRRDVFYDDVSEKDARYTFVKFMSVDEYQQAISEGLYNGDERDILSLRISLWMRYNDRYDENRRCNAKYSESEINKIDKKDLYEDNCQKILEIINVQTDDESILMQAELWRNLGEFNKCENLLGEIEKPEKYKRYMLSIKAACEAKNTLTIETKG